MIFEWDDAKEAANVEKHGLSFAQACTIFSGPIVTRRSDREGEERSVSFGLYEDVAVLAVVHTTRGLRTRIISARPANRSERGLYYEAIQQADER